MKKILRYILLLTFSLITTNYIWHNLTFTNSATTIVVVAIILALFELILKPTLHLLLLPISFLTLGGIRLIINTVGLYIATYFVNDFVVNTIATSGSYWQGFYIPACNFSGFFAYLVTSLSITIVYNLYNFILKRKSQP